MEEEEEATSRAAPSELLALLSPDRSESAVRASPRWATSASSFLPSQNVTARRGKTAEILGLELNTAARTMSSREMALSATLSSQPEMSGQEHRSRSHPQLPCKHPNFLGARDFPSVTLSFAVRRGVGAAPAPGGACWGTGAGRSGKASA